MKTVLCSLVFALVAFSANAQSNSDLVQVGDYLIIGSSDNGNFDHIHFPKKNLIIKRGGIADMKSVYGKTVVITEINSNNNGATGVVLERKDGRKFFRHLKSVTADLENALADGELKQADTAMKNEIAKR
ncbi:MAG: hypothetical protein AAGA86_07910 [Bacteroidota bacterium]